MEAACHKALVECNRKIHADHSIDDSSSGTTCIAALFHNKLLTVCNVGDSRAVVGQRDKRSRHGEYGADSYNAILLSRGDVIANNIGVFAEPKMVTLELTTKDQIIVLASDGVFEFLTN